MGSRVAQRIGGPLEPTKETINQIHDGDGWVKIDCVWDN